jgi:formate hydrogenlyase subunit 6/NADH:ubiquinone oxidoreductase subunit I
MLDLPVLDVTLCTGCRDCVPVCPTDCLEMNGSYPWLPRPADCISCSLCVLICPATALHMSGGNLHSRKYTSRRSNSEKPSPA